MIVGLHGLGGSQETFARETYRAVELAEEGGYILVAPVGDNSSGWYGIPATGNGGGRGRGFGGAGDRAVTDPARVRELSETDVMNVIEMVLDEFNVDEDRIYLTGHSMGGGGTYYLGAKYPDIWAALAPVAPAARRMSEVRDEILEDIKDAGIPIMVVHGEMDEAVPVEIAREWVAAMQEMGIEHEYVELPDVTHGPVIRISQEYIYEFFGRH